MRVVGISPLDKDSTASFVEDGRVVFACGEERLSRTKLQDGFPEQAVKLGLEKTGWDPASIDSIAYAFFDPEGEARLIRHAMEQDAERYKPGDTADSLRGVRDLTEAGYECDRSVPIPGIGSTADEFVPRKPWAKGAIYRAILASPRADWLAHRKGMREWMSLAIADHERRNAELNAGLAVFGWTGKLKRFAHHNTHAANAFYASGLDEALIVTLDGYGSGNAGGIYRGGADGIKNLIRFSFPNSLGQFYEHVTSALQFKPSRHEGKIVGLAAYGKKEILSPILEERFVTKDGDILMRAAGNNLFARALAETFSKRDIASAYQNVLESVATRTVAWWMQKTGLRNIVASGGVHANVKLNQRLREIPGVDQIFVYPNMGDGGCGTGAAMLTFDPALRWGPLENVYWGPEFTDAQIAEALQRNGLPTEQHNEIEERVAELLSRDAIIGRFNGRMEYGPRSLGNRSVLYPAKDPAVNQWLNQQLGRTEFMPFAPSVLASEAPRLFHRLEGCEKTAEFMTVTFDCTDEMKRLCPAAVHVDGTARPQLVTERSNPSFHRILKRYHDLTGIPSVINTSFNMHEEPIVCSPDDAIRAFLLGKLDYLAIGPFLVAHPEMERSRMDRTHRKVPSVQ